MEEIGLVRVFSKEGEEEVDYNQEEKEEQNQEETGNEEKEV